MKVFQKVFLLIFTSLFSTLVPAQSIDLKLEQIISSSYEVNVAKSPYFIRSVYKDSEGFIWLGLLNSVAKFDGSEYKEFFHHPSSNSGMLTSGPDIIKEDKRGNIWFGSWKGGVSMYDKKSQKFISILPTDYPITDLLVREDSSIWIFEKKGRLFKIHEQSSQLDSARFFHHENIDLKKKEENIGRVASNPSNTDELWIAGEEGMYKYNASTKRSTFIPYPSLSSPYYEPWPSPIMMDQLGQIYVGLYNGLGIFIYNSKKEEWTHQVNITSEHGLELGSNRMINIFPYEDSLVIASSWFNHFYLINSYSPADFSVKPYSEKQNCLGFFVDNENSIYVGLHDKMMIFDEDNNYFRDFTFQVYDDYDGKSNFQRSFLKDEVSERYYFGTAGGDGVLSYDLDLKNLRVFRERSSYGRDQFDVEINSLFRWRDTIWAATSEGLRYLQDGKIIPADFVFSTNLYHIDKSFSGTSRIWFTHKESGLFASNSVEEIILHGIKVYKISEWGERTLVIKSERGILIYDHLAKRLQEYPILKNPLITEYEIADLLIQDDTLWLGSRGNGLLQVFEEDGEFLVRQWLSEKGKGSNVINRLLLTKARNIWMATDRGFSCFLPERREILQFGVEDGVSFAPRSGLLQELTDGTIMASARNGFEYWNEHEVIADPIFLKPYIRNIYVNGKPKKFGENQTLVLLPNDDHLSIELGTIHHGQNSEIYYWYKLEGYDDEWIANGTNSIVQFTNLNPGNFDIQVRSSLQSKWRGGEVLKQRIRVKATFLERRIVRVLGLGLILAFLSLILYLYYDRRNKREALREKELFLSEVKREKLKAEMTALRSRMNPHFIFNSLNSIKWYILKEKPELASKYLSKFSKLMRHILDYSKQEMISLEEEISWLRLYVELESLRFEEEIIFRVNVDEEVDPEIMKIPTLIIQPFIENSIWHGLADKKGYKEVELHVQLFEDYIEIRIKDNGVGRKSFNITQQAHKSSGIKITTQRIIPFSIDPEEPLEIKDLCDQSGKPTGTEVVIKITNALKA